MSDQTTFKGVSNYFDSGFSDKLAWNLSAYSNWAFLEIGAFYNTSMSVSGSYGGDFTRLRAVQDPNYVDGQVWEGVRSNWVYESGLSYSYQPVKISGVYINSSFYDVSTTGVLSYKINYPFGRVVFDNPIDTNSIVKCEYSYKYVNVSTADTPWFRKFQTDSLRVDNPQFLQVGSGDWSIFSQSRVQLPAIVVQPLNRVSFEGLQLGGGQIRYQDMLLHVLCETPWDRNNISDIFLNQRNKLLYIVDTNKAASSGVLPLDLDGGYVPGGYMYPDLIRPDNGYLEYQSFVYEASADTIENVLPLYYAVIRLTMRTQVNDI